MDTGIFLFLASKGYITGRVAPIITEEIIAYCKMMKDLGLPVSGPADGSLKTIRVVKK